MLVSCRGLVRVAMMAVVGVWVFGCTGDRTETDSPRVEQASGLAAVSTSAEQSTEGAGAASIAPAAAACGPMVGPGLFPAALSPSQSPRADEVLAKEPPSVQPQQIPGRSQGNDLNQRPSGNAGLQSLGPQGSDEFGDAALPMSDDRPPGILPPVRARPVLGKEPLSEEHSLALRNHSAGENHGVNTNPLRDGAEIASMSPEGRDDLAGAPSQKASGDSSAPVVASGGRLTDDSAPEGHPAMAPASDATSEPALRIAAGNSTSSGTSVPSAEVAIRAGTGDSKPKPPPRKGKHSGIPFDPIKENGPIFEGWPKPDLALIITGREEGYIEPCGCAGLDRMKGGMARRQTLFRTLREQGWQVVGLDVGGLARGFGKQAELKFQTMVEAKRKTGYDAVAFGTSDLRLPAGELASVAASADGGPGMFVATNVGLFGMESGIVPRSKVIERRGAALGVLAVVGRETRQAIRNDEIEIIDAAEAIRKELPELRKRVRYIVLLAHTTREEADELARRFPEINLVVYAGGPAEPPAKLTFIDGTRTIRVEVGEKGMNAVVVAFFADDQEPVRYQRVPLDARFEGSAEMKALLTAYQDQLRMLGWEGLNLRPVPHPQVEVNGRFVGSEKCRSCHEESYRVWKRTGHSRAFATLENLDPPRHFDPECVSCHVIGWHPTKYFPYENGFISKEKTPELIDVGCESCHGPGEKHVVAEMGADTGLQERLRKAMVVTKEESAKRQCYTCHDLDNSPDFEFESYWPIVEHYED